MTNINQKQNLFKYLTVKHIFGRLFIYVNLDSREPWKCVNQGKM